MAFAPLTPDKSIENKRDDVYFNHTLCIAKYAYVVIFHKNIYIYI